ncbi:hypothetical protein TGRH88_024020 [Toxoplasma gondii]|uniref:Uncharacterized protein n=1 Tax=Toxoplasma gondii TaxID=5811 RepID=A0A7J6K928_TOXGO|nr:hypothetical protein TGRH88_024020 [Toxoplasma gondii]
MPIVSGDIGYPHVQGSPVSPSPKLLERYRAAYRSTVDKKRQEMSALEQSIHQAQVEEAQLRALLLGRRSKGGEAPAEPGTEGHPPPSTSTAQSEGPGAQGGPGIHAVPPETESAELPEATSPVPGCSWWSTSPPVTSLRPRPKGVEPGSAADERVSRLQIDINRIRASRLKLVEERRCITRRWSDEESFVNLRLQMMNTRRKKKKVSYAEQRRLLTGPGSRPVHRLINGSDGYHSLRVSLCLQMAAIVLSPELHQQLSRQYRERCPQRFARVEDLSKEIRMLEEKEKSLTAQLWHARQSNDLAAETRTQASGVSSSTEPAETSDMAGQSSPRGTIQVPRDLVERQSEPAFEKPLDEAVASPFVAQTPFRSPTPVTTTEGAWRESAAVASTTHSMASGDLTTSSDWLTHAERTSESASSLIWHHQTAPLFAPGAPQAVVYGGPCTSGDSGGPPYSLSPTVEHAGAAHTTGDPRTESDIPDDVVEFVLSYSAPAVMASGDGAALFAESAPSFIQPWSSEYPPPPVVSPSEQAATSASLVQPTTSASDEGATLFAIPASSSAFLGPGWSSPQLQPSWCRHRMHPDTHPNSGVSASRDNLVDMNYPREGSYVMWGLVGSPFDILDFNGASGHDAPLSGEPLAPVHQQPLFQSPAWPPAGGIVPPPPQQLSTTSVGVPSTVQHRESLSPQRLSMSIPAPGSTSTTEPQPTSPSQGTAESDQQ